MAPVITVTAAGEKATVTYFILHNYPSVPSPGLGYPGANNIPGK